MSTGEMFCISRSSLYHVWMAERAEIARNKWFISEREGVDCGWERARFDWDMRFRPAWISGMKASGLYPS